MYQRVLKIIAFLFIYSLSVFFIVLLLAKPFGRVPLPVIEKNNVQPLNIFTCFLNRNYVKPELKESLMNVAHKINNKFPGTIINYLDANFPFFDGVPLLPHLSHNDGEKLDISFCYVNKETKVLTNECPSFIGYGISEEPLLDEKCTTCFCTENGFWQYDLLRKLTPQYNKKNFTFDEIRTKELVNLFALENRVQKIFIEPHIKTRLNLNADKIRFHGCKAIRHDDHIHIQM